jgi:hypothetical protein
MTAREFAEKYADRKVRFKYALSYPDSIGGVVGWGYGNIVYVALSAEYKRKYQEPGTLYPLNTINWTSEDDPQDIYGYSLRVSSIELCDNETVINTKDFPHICNKCKSPAYISAFSIQCSKQGCVGK